MKHTPDLQGEEFRLSWVTLITMLRTVGHVLEFVDAPRSLHLKAAIRAAFEELQRTKPEPDIFWRFIYEERNNVLKRYRIGPERVIGGDPGPGRVAWRIDVGSMVSKPGRVARIEADSPVKSRIKHGPFMGRDEREVAAEAIEWWEHYLDDVERDAERRAASDLSTKTNAV
jgi:hypothetical protein